MKVGSSNESELQTRKMVGFKLSFSGDGGFQAHVFVRVGLDLRGSLPQTHEFVGLRPIRTEKNDGSARSPRRLLIVIKVFSSLS